MAISPRKVDHQVLAIVKVQPSKRVPAKYHFVVAPWADRESIIDGEAGESIAKMLSTTGGSSIEWLTVQLRRWCKKQGVVEVEGLAIVQQEPESGEGDG